MVTVSIASTPDREKQLIRTVNSLIKQVNFVNVCLNNYKHNPFKGLDKVNVKFSDNSLGDAGRYLFLKDYEGYYFTADDDLRYDRYYIEDTIQRMVENNYKIVSYHGRNFDKFPIQSYYNSATEKYRCLGEVKEDVKVQFGGTGVMCFHTDNFKPSIDLFKRSNMADIFIGCEAKRLGIDITCLSHKIGYFEYMKVPTTIYDTKCNNDRLETKIANFTFS